MLNIILWSWMLPLWIAVHSFFFILSVNVFSHESTIQFHFFHLPYIRECVPITCPLFLSLSFRDIPCVVSLSVIVADFAIISIACLRRFSFWRFHKIFFIYRGNWKKQQCPKNKTEKCINPRSIRNTCKQWFRWFFLIFIFGCLIINNKSAHTIHTTHGIMVGPSRVKNKDQSHYQWKYLCGLMKHAETLYRSERKGGRNMLKKNTGHIGDGLNWWIEYTTLINTYQKYVTDLRFLTSRHWLPVYTVQNIIFVI